MSRSEQLRRQNRRIFAVSLAIAVALHVLVFVGSPVFRAEPLDQRVFADSAAATEERGEGGSFANVFFGPPRIVLDNGSVWQEPDDRVLEAREVDIGSIVLSGGCDDRSRVSLMPVSVDVGLVLNRDGRVVREQVAESSGDPCRDELIEAITRTVWYHWVPNERFPAPVEMIQPVRAVRVGS